MLRRKDDMKEWQKETLPIHGIKAPKGLPVDDAPEIPEGFIPEMKPKRRGGRPKKASAEEKAESVEVKSEE